MPEGKLNSPELWPISNADLIEQLPGGITFSGGEALLQADTLVPVCQALHDNDIHIAVETRLFIPSSNLNLALEMVNFFYVDVKILSPDRCKEVEHGNLDLYLSNFHTLLSEDHGAE